MALDELHAVTGWDKWFLERIAVIIDAEASLARDGIPGDRPRFRH